MSNITFPYASFEQGQKDNWSKIGGVTEAFRHMSNGFKQSLWRKESNSKRQDQVKEALALLKKFKEEEEKKGKDKADKQLGR